MSVKWAAVFAVAGAAGQPTVTAVCAELGISRQTFYRYRRLFAESGAEGLAAVSRRPRVSPAQTSAQMSALIVTTRHELAKEGWDHGAWSVFYRLQRLGLQPPHPRTIHRVMVRAGTVAPEPRKRPRSSYRSFEYPASDDCWQLDGVTVCLADGSQRTVLHLIDDCSRFVVGLRAAPAETTAEAWQCVADAIGHYGAPLMMLSDNSLAFTGRSVGHWVEFETNLARIGVKTIHARPRHPQTCGKNERAHQTLQRWLAAQPPPPTQTHLQTLLDRFAHDFNHRPHQGLQGQTPAERRTERTRTIPAQRPPLAAPMRVITGAVSTRGTFKFDGKIVSLGTEHAGRTINAFITPDTATIFWRHQMIHHFTLDHDHARQPGRRHLERTRRNLTP